MSELEHLNALLQKWRDTDLFGDAVKKRTIAIIERDIEMATPNTDRAQIAALGDQTNEQQ